MDDACASQSQEKWRALEDLFAEFGIKPLVAVVPDNHDPELECSAFPDPNFWEMVHRWNDKGWTIAMHGYRHVMHETKAKLVLPFYQRSEFGGLPYEEQAEKIRRSWEIFVSRGIEPTVWVAPAHCFDLVTLEAIRNETPIRIVSDGIARDQFYAHGFYWIPQQLWGLTDKNSGLWTVCLHPNTMTDQHMAALRESLENGYAERIVALDAIALEQRKKSFIDHVESFRFWQRHRLNKVRSRLITIIRA